MREGPQLKSSTFTARFPTRKVTAHRSSHHNFHCYSIPMPLSFPESQPWDHVSRYASISWLLAYSLFLLHAFRDTSGFLFPDLVNLMIHEAGHLFFSWGGNTLMILARTLADLLVPLPSPLSFSFPSQTSPF